MHSKGITGGRERYKFQAGHLSKLFLLSHWSLNLIALAYEWGSRGVWVWSTSPTTTLHTYGLIRIDWDKTSTWPLRDMQYA